MQTKTDAGRQFPLPAGEGQGEGERDAANQHSRKNFANSTRTPLRVRVDHHIERKAWRPWKRERSPAQWCFEPCFPLTPVLPPWERVKRQPLRGESDALSAPH